MKCNINSYVRAPWMNNFESLLPPLKMRLLSGEMATQPTRDSCLVFIWWTVMALVSSLWTLDERDHRWTVLSPPPETMKDPSVENSIAAILSVSPTRSRHWKNNRDCWRLAAKQFSRNDKTLREVSREAEAIVVSCAATALAFEDFFFFFDLTAAIST